MANRESSSGTNILVVIFFPSLTLSTSYFDVSIKPGQKQTKGFFGLGMAVGDAEAAFSQTQPPQIGLLLSQYKQVNRRAAKAPAPRKFLAECKGPIAVTN